MSAEFEAIAKAREETSDEAQSKSLQGVVVSEFCDFSVVSIVDTGNVWVFADMVDFTDEEGYGKYLDLHFCYEKYMNVKAAQVLHNFLFFTKFYLCNSTTYRGLGDLQMTITCLHLSRSRQPGNCSECLQ